jgi:hypothetical protein
MPKAKLKRGRPAATDRVDPTPEQLKRNRYETARVKDPNSPAPIMVRRNLTTRNLERWLQRGAIDARQFAAGDLYRTDYERAGFNQQLIGRYGERGMTPSAPSQAGGLPATLAQLEARERYRAARAQLPADLVAGFERLMIHDEMWQDASTTGGGAARDFNKDTWGTAVRLLLFMLAAHYRIPEAVNRLDQAPSR